MNSQMKRYIRGPEGSQVQSFFLLGTVCTTIPACGCFINPEAHQLLMFKGFYRASSVAPASPSQSPVDGAESSNPLITWSF